jgi:hypothetical protein
MIVIGVDPGKITGIAMWQQLTPETLGSGTIIGPIKSWAVAEVPTTRVLSHIRVVLRGRKPTAIACERFIQGTGRRPMSFQPDAQHITGEMSALAQELGCPFVRQLPGPAKKIASDKVLKQLGCYTVSPDGHANDGCRQVIRYLADHHPDVFAALLGI